HTKTHDGLVPAGLLEGYRGYVHADASSVYHELYRREAEITEVGCWAQYPEYSVITRCCTIPAFQCDAVGQQLWIKGERSKSLDARSWKQSWHGRAHPADASPEMRMSPESCGSGGRAIVPKAPSANTCTGSGASAATAST
ncbi:MAG TPA: hypothetical protein VMK12_23470, partial [Anaeromyxobacteraceae bacterium]|nr:hypothetical protein [Anaeromyxobacteraceae bacterium]